MRNKPICPAIVLPPTATVCVVQWAAVALLVVTTGCAANDSGEDQYAVTGKVTYQGSPVGSGKVIFFPDRGAPHGGPLQADGTFQFQMPPGQYAVVVDAPAPVPEDWQEGDPPPDLRPLVPVQYSRRQTSKLTAEVRPQAEPNVINFELN